MSDIKMSDVARLANVSVATVSRYLSNPSLVSMEKRTLLREIIEHTNYLPNELARGLSKNSSTVVGVILPDINNLFYSAVMVGIEDELDHQGFSTLICNTHNCIEKEKRYIDILLGRKAAGIIPIGTRPLNPALSAHWFEVAKKIPVVMLNDYLSTDEVSYVVTCEEPGIYSVVEYLARLNHTNIAFINGDAEYTTFLYKRNGFNQAVRDFGIEGSVIETLVPPYECGGYQGMLDILGSYPKITAVVCASDQIAIGAVRAVFESGLNVPMDISVTGFSNSPISGEIFPRLTTVDQFPVETGRRVASVLAEKINGKNEQRYNIRLNTRLVVRNSCAKMDQPWN